VSEVSEDAIVRILIADYASTDAAGKLNLIGGGLAVIGVQGPQLGGSEGNTAPFGLFVSLAVGPRLYGSECAAELILEDESDQVVAVPTPDSKGSQPMRIAQNIVFEEPNLPRGSPRVPRNVLPAKVQWVLMFPGGLTLTPGTAFHWRVKIDHESRPDWVEQFFVPAAPGPIVVG